MAAADFFHWMDEHGAELEAQLAELEREDPKVRAAARELEASLPPGLRLEKIFIPSRRDDDEGDLEGTPDNVPDSSQ